MDNFFLGRYAHLDRIWHPLILFFNVASTDIYSLLGTGSLPVWDRAYVVITIPMYLLLLLVVSNSIQYGKRRRWRVYFQYRLLLLLTITSLFRIKETMITPPTPVYYFTSVGLDVVYIAAVHFGSKALIEVMEGESYENIRDTDMDAVFSKRWTFFGIRLRTLLLGQVMFSVKFTGFHVFYYFTKLRNPAVVEAGLSDVSYSIITLALPLICFTILIIKSILVYGVHRKSVKILTVCYYCKSVLVVTLRLFVVAMLHKEHGLAENTAFARTIAKLTVLPTGLIFQFEIAQVLRWITYFSLEAEIPIGNHLPNFGEVEYSKTKVYGFFQIAETNKHLRDFLRSVMIPRQRIKMGHKLGEGHFANVYSAELKRRLIHPWKARGQQVAVKVSKGEFFDGEFFKSICSELKILHTIGDHDYLVKFVGVTKIKIGKGSGAVHELGIISELCAEGNLLNYLRNSLAPQFDSMDKGKTTLWGFERIMTTWAYQISSGMEFLSRKKIIHGDLAARNILLNEKLVCKISDFGMSFRLYTYQVYATTQQNALPYRWMAPETLSDFKFSLKSDIWSFGVLLWEIFSYGDEPYVEEVYTTGIDCTFVQRRKDGMFLNRPKYCSPEIYKKVLKKCWEVEPSLRPEFGELAEYFSRPLGGTLK